MESLALVVALMALVMLASGPVSLVFWYFNMPVLATIFGLLAMTVGLQWFNSVSTSARFVGLVPMIIGGFVVGFFASKMWP